MGEPLFHRALFRLELRRTLGGALALGTLALAGTLALGGGDWTPGPLAGVGDDPAALSALSRGLARQAIWGGTLLLLVPALTLRAAGTLGRWRAGEGDWLGSRPTGRLGALISVLAGCTGGGAVLLGGTAAVVEARVASRAPALLLAWERDLVDRPPIPPGETFEVRLALPRSPGAGARLRVRLCPTPGAGPTTDAMVQVRRPEGAQARVRGRIATRTWLECPLPGGTGGAGELGELGELGEPGELRVQVENGGPGYLALMEPGTFQLWTPGGGEWRGSPSLVAHSLLALAPLVALALGFGAWVGTLTAWIGALCTPLAAAVLLGSPAWYPGAGLARALDHLGQARLPGWPPAASLAPALGLVALGLVLARLGLRSWGHGS